MANEFMGASPEELQEAMKKLQEAMKAAGVDPSKVMGDSNKPKSDKNVPKSTGKKAYKTTEKVITPRYSNILTPEGETNFENTATTKVRNLRITDDYVQFAEKALKKYKKDEEKLREAFAENNFYYIPGVTEKIVAHHKSVDELNVIKDLQKKAAQDKEKLRRQLIKSGEFGTRKFVNAMADADKEIEKYEKPLTKILARDDMDSDYDVNRYIMINSLPPELQKDVFQQNEAFRNKGLLEGANALIEGSKDAGTNDFITGRYRKLVYGSIPRGKERELMNDQSISKQVASWNGKSKEKPRVVWQFDDAGLNKGRFVVNVIGAPGIDGKINNQVKLVPFGAKLKTFQDNLKRRFGNDYQTSVIISHPNSAYFEGTPEEAKQYLNAIKTGDWSNTKLPRSMNIPSDRAELMNMFNLNSDYYLNPEKFKSDHAEAVQKARDLGYESYSDYFEDLVAQRAAERKVEEQRIRDEGKEATWKMNWLKDHYPDDPDVRHYLDSKEELKTLKYNDPYNKNIPDMTSKLEQLKKGIVKNYSESGDYPELEDAYKYHVYDDEFKDAWAEKNEKFADEADKLGKHFARMTRLRNNIAKATDYAKRYNDYVNATRQYENVPNVVTRDTATPIYPAGLYKKDKFGNYSMLAEKPEPPVEYTLDYLKSLQEGRSEDVVDTWQNNYNNLGGDAVYNRLNTFFHADPDYADGTVPAFISDINQHLGADPKDATKTADIGKNLLYWVYDDSLPENKENPFLAKFPTNYMLDQSSYDREKNAYLESKGLPPKKSLLGLGARAALRNSLRDANHVKNVLAEMDQDLDYTADMNRGLTPEQIAKNKEIMENAGTIIPSKRKENMFASERVADDITQASADKKEDERFTAKLNAKKAAASSYTKFMNAFAKENSAYSKDELKKMMPRGVYEKRVNSGGEDAARTYLSNRVANADKQKEAQKQQNGITAAVTPFGMRYEPKSDVSDDTLLYGEKNDDFGGKDEE